MLGNYEKRHFTGKDPLWVGKYRNLSNVLHWHSECELIWIIKGNAQIKIRNELFDGRQDDLYFCCSEDLHYIKSNPDTIIQIIIFRKDLVKDITGQYSLISPKITNTQFIKDSFLRIEGQYNGDHRFRCEQLRNAAEALLIYIFDTQEIQFREHTKQPAKKIIEKLHNDFSHITFTDIVGYSGYTPSHFSKKFKELTGMGFSQYLNCIKIEYAVSLLQQSPSPSITEICAQCGFTTIRNFNRVFKEMTGYTPSTLPNQFSLDADLKVFKADHFDPTEQTSVKL